MLWPHQTPLFYLPHDSSKSRIPVLAERKKFAPRNAFGVARALVFPLKRAQHNNRQLANENNCKLKCLSEGLPPINSQRYIQIFGHKGKSFAALASAGWGSWGVACQGGGVHGCWWHISGKGVHISVGMILGVSVGNVTSSGVSGGMSV